MWLALFLGLLQPRPRKGLIELPPLLAREHTIWKTWTEDYFTGHGMFAI